MKCPNCNHDVAEGNQFCMNCGAKLNLHTVADLTSDADASAITPNTKSTQAETNAQKRQSGVTAAELVALSLSGKSAPSQEEPKAEAQSSETAQAQEPQDAMPEQPQAPQSDPQMGAGSPPPPSNPTYSPYDTPPKKPVNGMMIGMIVASVLAVVFAIFGFMQASKVKQISDELATKEATIASLSSQLDQAQAKADLAQGKADFMDEYVVIVFQDDPTHYHKFGCIPVAEKTFWVFNKNYAEYMGMTPDPACN